MRTFLFFIFLMACFTGNTWAQIYSPIATTGHDVDAIAENTLATNTTGAAIDGSDYILYSAAYGQLYNPVGTGLPNSGLISAGTRTYQLEPYTQNNTLYIPGLQMDSLTLNTPAQFPSISLLAFATEGAGAMNIKLRFTDGSTQLVSNLTLPDWFNTVPTNTVIMGFDRCGRTTGTPTYAGSNTPRMFYIDINLDCANRLKNLQRIVVQNTTANPRLCIMAAAGAAAAVYNATTSPVTCSGGNNGSATLSIAGGVPPFTYAWSTLPSQSTATANLLATGITNYTVTDASGCASSSFVTVGQALAPTAPLTITASSNPVCAGSTLTLSTSGAITYNWSNNGSGASTTIAPVTSGNYSVTALNSANCTFTGSIAISVNALPALTFTSVPDKLCLNSGAVALTASPGGGTFQAQGISFGSFYPSLALAGTHTISYTYTDANGCTSNTVVTTVISTPTTVINFTITPATICINSASLALNATPAGGTYSGTGVSGTTFFPAQAGIGTKTVSYTYTDANNCTAKKVSSITVNTCTYVSVQELTSGAGFELYPNPSAGGFYLKTSADVQVSIINELGQPVRSIKLDALNSHRVYVEGLAPGIYFLATPNRVLNQKIVITP